ncbi:glycosyltransferase family 2 protein [Lachnospiraceae bacterium 56-18]
MTKEPILLTVVVTVYNVEAYIPQCIESIMNQTYKNLQIILIDDGSADDSGHICDGYANKDERIQVFHKNNAGLVAARRQGAEMAKGDLVTFVDGDDWVDTDMYESMIEAYKTGKADMVTSGMIWEWESRTEFLYDNIEAGIYEKEAIQNKIFPRLMSDMANERQGITASVCNKLFKPVLLNKVISSIDPELTLGEDGAVTYYYAVCAERIRIMDRSWYHYRQHGHSMRISQGLGSFEKIYRLKINLMNNLKVCGLEGVMENQVNAYVKHFLLDAVKDVYEMELNVITHVFPYEKIPKNSKVILYGAGIVGKSYWKCLHSGKYAELAAWVDRDYRRYQLSGLSVESVERVRSQNYDYIIIAIEKENIAKEVEKTLLNYGVEKKKIVW